MASHQEGCIGDTLRAEEFLAGLMDCLESLEACSKTTSDNDESQTVMTQNRSFSLELQTAEITEVRKQIFSIFSEFNNHLQENLVEVTPTVFAKTLSNCLQFICNGVLHCTHQNEIYGSRTKEKNFREFIKRLSMNCGTLSATCFEVTKKNLPYLYKSNREDIYELMEVSTQCLVVATSQPNVLPPLAKVFAAILRPFQNFYKSDSTETLSVGTTMIKHLREVVGNMSSKMLTEDKASTAQIKMVNYFGKLVTTFLSGVSLNGSEWRECLTELMNIVKFAEGANGYAKKEVGVLDYYPEVVSAFVNIPNFPKEVVILTDRWETKLRVLAKLRIMVACSSSLGSFEILTSIFRDIAQLHEENSDTQSPNLIEHVSREILPLLRQFIRALNEIAFERFQKDVVTFFVDDWPETFSPLVADLITGIFGFIVQNLDDGAREEYLTAFSNPCLPPQLRYFVFPALVKHHSQDPEQDNLDKLATDVELVRRYTCILRRAEAGVLKAKDLEFFKLFWTRVKDANSSTIMDKLLPLCADTAKVMSYLDQVILYQVFLAAEGFLRNPTPISILGCCVILLGAKQVVFEESPPWAAVSSICGRIIKTCKQIRDIPSCVALFAMKCVCYFMDEVKVQSEGMVLKLRSHIQEITSEEVSQSSTPVAIPADDKVEFLVPMFEKITKDIIKSNVQPNPNERLRLRAAISQLNEFMSRIS